MGYEQITHIIRLFPETTEEPHFDKVSFRIRKKIFLTYDSAKNSCVVKLSLEDQDIFCLSDQGAAPVPNKWGKQGWTVIDLNVVSEELLTEMVKSAYCTVAPKKLADQVR